MGMVRSTMLTVMSTKEIGLVDNDLGMECKNMKIQLEQMKYTEVDRNQCSERGRCSVSTSSHL